MYYMHGAVSSKQKPNYVNTTQQNFFLEPLCGILFSAEIMEAQNIGSTKTLQ